MTSTSSGADQDILFELGLGAIHSTVVESCHSWWIFDEGGRRFRRVLKWVGTDTPVCTDWRPYDHYLVDEESDAFLIFLDEEGSRLLRSRRHVPGACTSCGETERTSELRVEELDRFEEEARPTRTPVPLREALRHSFDHAADAVGRFIPHRHHAEE